MLLSSWGTPVLASMARDTLPRAAEIQTDPRVLLFTLGVSMAAGLLFGLAPALQISRARLNSDLRSEGRGATSGQAAQCAAQSAGGGAGGALAGAADRRRAADPQFRSTPQHQSRVRSAPGALDADLPASGAAIQALAKMTAFYDQLLASVRTVPGVSPAAESSALPANPARFSPRSARRTAASAAGGTADTQCADHEPGVRGDAPGSAVAGA